MNGQRLFRLVMVSCFQLLPAIMWAQAETGNIIGIVKDTSGAVLPGVTAGAGPAVELRIRPAVL